MEIGNEVGLGLHVGRYSFDQAGDYTDYSISFSKSFNGLDFGLGYYDTDIDGLDGRPVFSIGKSF